MFPAFGLGAKISQTLKNPPIFHLVSNSIIIFTSNISSYLQLLITDYQCYSKILYIAIS